MIKPSYCFTSKCPLSRIGTGFSAPCGLGTSGVAVVGEALGGDEAIHGYPFYEKAQAGSKLEEIFRLANVNRSMFYLTNIVSCQPPNNMLEGAWYQDSAINHCSRHFQNNMDKFTPISGMPRVILALGNIPLKALTGVSGLAYEKQSVSFVRGYVYNNPRFGYIIPGYHPSFLKRGKPQFTPSLVADLRKTLEVASGEYTDFPGGATFKKPKYNEHPSLEDCYSLYNRIKDNQRLVVSCDIETPKSGEVEEDEREILDQERDITQVQFSFAKRTGIAIPYRSPYVDIISKIFSLENTKLGFNWWNFDGPRLKDKGVTVNGRMHDLMWMFKHWNPGLERALQKVASLFYFPFPWKHMFGDNLQWYGCADVDAPIWIWEKLPSMMKERGVWTGYQDMLRNHLILDKARDRGLPVAEDKRVTLGGELRVRRIKLNEELQKDIPDEIKNISPRRKDKGTGEVTFGYIREPKEVKQGKKLYASYVGRCKGKGREPITLSKYIRRRYNLVRRKFQGINKESGEFEEVVRWCKILPFKASSQQLVKYLKWKQKKLLEEPDRKVEI